MGVLKFFGLVSGVIESLLSESRSVMKRLWKSIWTLDVSKPSLSSINPGSVPSSSWLYEFITSISADFTAFFHKPGFVSTTPHPLFHLILPPFIHPLASCLAPRPSYRLWITLKMNFLFLLVSVFYVSKCLRKKNLKYFKCRCDVWLLSNFCCIHASLPASNHLQVIDATFVTSMQLLQLRSDYWNFCPNSATSVDSCCL